MKKMMTQRFNAAVLLLLICSSAAVSQVDESFDLDTYEVDHEEGQTLLEAINQETPIRERGKIFHGYTKWFIRWNFRWWEDPNGTCRITEVTTSLDVDMTLPELDDATAAARARFNTYLRALREHEDGHRKIARDAAQQIDRGILALRPMSSCSALSQAANDLGQSILSNTRVIERKYDVDTDHGCTQGACL